MAAVGFSYTHTARKLNVSVDSPFRKFQDKHEWMLNKEAFKVILSLHPELNTDLFATRLNNQLEMYAPGNLAQGVPS